jgi:hypothetical protein
VAIAAIAIAVAVRGRNRAALVLARQAIAKAQKTATPLGRIELAEAEREIAQVVAREDSIAEQLDRTLTILRMIEQDAFSGGAGVIRIVP